MKQFISGLLLASFFLFFSCSDDDGPGPSTDPEKNSARVVLKIQGETDASSLKFGKLATTKFVKKSITIKNEGDSTLSITDIRVPEGFIPEWISANIPANEQKTLEFTFAPIEVKNYTGRINITSNATNEIPHFLLEGDGVSPTYVGNVRILNQKELQDFIEIGYTRIKGTLYLGYTSRRPGYTFPYTFSDLSPLQNILSVYNLSIINTEINKLWNIGGLEISRGLVISRNINLEDVDLPNSSGGNYAIDVSIVNNKSLRKLSGLERFEKMKSLEIKNCPNLPSLDGLQRLQIVEDKIVISNCDLIPDLYPLENLQSVSSININRNANLFDFCAIQSLLEINGGSINFENPVYNRYNPSEIKIVEGDCRLEVVDGQYYGDLTLSSEEDVNEFGTYNIVEFFGKLSIMGNAGESPISNLSALNSLKYIEGEFNIISNTDLDNLNGLNNLEYVLGTINIIGNSALADYCEITPLIINVHDNQLNILNNYYNPTYDDFHSGQCSP